MLDEGRDCKNGQGEIPHLKQCTTMQVVNEMAHRPRDTAPYAYESQQEQLRRSLSSTPKKCDLDLCRRFQTRFLAG